MAKITDYPKVASLSDNDTFLLDNADGTRGILAKDLAKEVDKMTTSTLDPTQTIVGADTMVIETTVAGAKVKKTVTAANVAKTIPLKDLESAVSLTGNETVVLSIGGVNKKMTVSELIKKFNLNNLEAVTTMTANDMILVGGSAGGASKMTQTALLDFLSKNITTEDVDVTAYPEINTLAGTNLVLIGDGKNNKKLTVTSLMEYLNQNLDDIDLAGLPAVSTLTDADLILVGNAGVNKKITTANLVTYLNTVIEGGGGMSGDLFEYLDSLEPAIGYPLRRMLWRGKNLGTSVTAAQFTAISNGSFKGMFVGDYWTINGRVWRIMDFNYWLGVGDTECTTNHIVVVPDKNLYTQRMNSSDTTTTGYATSEMRSSGLNNAKTTVNTDFGSAHVLSHREHLTNASSNGGPSGGSWYDCTVEIPSEIMFYGTKILGVMNDGGSVRYNYDVNKSQLAGFQANPKMICPYRENNWLRDIVSGAHFAYVYDRGYATALGASYSNVGVRPVVGIKG